MRQTKLLESRAIKFAVVLAIPFALYLLIAERYSWRPRVLPHNADVYAAAFSADGQSLTTAQTDGVLFDWRVKSKQVIRARPLPHYRKSVERWSVFSPDQSLLAVCSDDCAVRLWNVRTGKFLHSFVQGRTERYTPSVAFAPDGKTIATASWQTPVKLWDAVSGKQRLAFQSQMRASHMAFSPDGRLLATTRGERMVKLWSSVNGKLLRILTSKRTVNQLAFSPDSTLLAAGSDSDGGAQAGEVMLWDTQTWQLKRTLDGHSDFGPMLMPTFSPDSQFIASCAASSVNAGIKLWNISTGQLVREIKANGVPLMFSPDGSLLVTSGGYDRSVELWRVK